MGGVLDVTFFFHRNDFTESRTEGHNLEATTVGQGGTEPGRSFAYVLWLCWLPVGEATRCGDSGGFAAEVKTVCEHGLGSESVQIFGGNETDITGSSDCHEGGSFDLAMSSLDNAGATKTVWQSFFNDKFHCYIIT